MIFGEPVAGPTGCPGPTDPIVQLVLTQLTWYLHTSGSSAAGVGAGVGATKEGKMAPDFS